MVERMPCLVAFWTFGEPAGEQRLSQGTQAHHPPREMGGPIARVEGGPFSGYSVELNGKQCFRIPYAETGDLNISGLRPKSECSRSCGSWISSKARSRQRQTS